MKRSKKLIAMLLAAVMALSTLSVGFSVFAATPGEIAAIEKEIMDSATISDTLITKVKALTNDEKDALSAKAYTKLWNKVYAAQPAKDAGGKAYTSFQKMEMSEAALGGHSTQGAIAKELALEAAGSKVVTYTDDTGTVPEFTLPTTSVSNYSYGADYSVTDYADYVIVEGKKVYKKYVVTPAMQKIVAEHLFKSYNEAAKNARTILLAEAFYTTYTDTDGGHVAYMDVSPNNMKTTPPVLTTVDKYVAAVFPQLKAEAKEAKMYELVTIPNAAPYNLQDGMNQARVAAKAYDKYLAAGSIGATNEVAFRAVVDPWIAATTVDGTDAFFAGKIGRNCITFDGAVSGITTLISKCKTAIKVIEGRASAVVYDTYLKTIVIPEVGSVENNAVIAEVKAKYNALTSEAKTIVKANPTTWNLYNKILAKGILQPGGNEHELFTDPIVVESELQGALADVVGETLLPSITYLVNNFLAGALVPGATNLTEALQSLFNNETATIALQALYPLLFSALNGMPPVMGMEVPDLFDLTPAKLGITIKEPKYAKVREQLLKFGKTQIGMGGDEELTDDGKGTVEDWAKVPTLEWGITDGNYEEFITALLTGMKGLTGGLGGALVLNPLLKKAIVGTYKMLPDGSGIDATTFVPGGWDYFIIPLLEALGVDGAKIPSVVDYAGEIEATGATMVNYLKPLIDVLYYELLPALQKDPLDYLANMLPNLMYHLEDGCLIDGLNKLLNNANVSIFGNVIDLKPMVMELFKVDGVIPDAISIEMVWNMISGLLSSTGISITLDDLYKIGKMGTASVVETPRITVDATVKVVADKDSVINYITNAVGGLLGNLIPNLDFEVQKEFVKKEAPKYPHDGKMDKKVMNNMINGLDGILTGLFNINDLINSGVATQAMAAQAIEAVYSLLGSIDLSILNINLSPRGVAAMMTEKKYESIVADLDKDTWADVSLYLANDNETIYQTDMGFKDGDRDGFLDCLVASLRPLTKTIGASGLLANTTAEDGSTVYGLYDTLIIPLFEALGITPAATSATYTSNYNQLMKKTDKNAAYDYLLNTVLSPVLGLINQLSAAPVDTLMNLIPNLVYSLQYNPSFAFIGNLLSKDAAGNIDLAGMVNGLIGGLLPGFELPAIDLDAFASAGTVTEVKSMSATFTTTTVVKTDKADAFVTTFNYLYDAINYKGNLKAIKDMIGKIEGMDSTISGLVDSLLNQVFTASKEESLCLLGTLLAADVWECPNGDAGGNGTGTGNGNKTPSTGETAVSAIALMSVLFAAGAAIVVLKKKKQAVN